MASSKTGKQAVTAAPPSDSIVVSVDVAKYLYELYHNIEAADNIFKSCQSTQFRQHVKSTYTAKNVQCAFEAIKTAIDNIECHKNVDA